jgi:hypothetical protein
LLFKNSLGPKNGLERRVWQFYTICDKKSASKTKFVKVTAILVLHCNTQMAGFQLAGPVADVSKILYGENRKSYQSSNAQYNISGFRRRHTVECSNYRGGSLKGGIE